MLLVKAKVLSRAGTIEFEGSPEAVSVAIRALEQGAREPLRRRPLKPSITSMVEGGFFVTPRSLADIKAELAGRRVEYNPASLFPVLYKDFLKPRLISQRGKRGSYAYFSRKGVGSQ